MFKPGPFHLGWGVLGWSGASPSPSLSLQPSEELVPDALDAVPAVRIIAVFWTCFIVVLLALPQIIPVVSDNMNYASAVTGGVVLLSTGWFFIGGRKHYKVRSPSSRRPLAPPRLNSSHETDSPLACTDRARGTSSPRRRRRRWRRRATTSTRSRCPPASTERCVLLLLLLLALLAQVAHPPPSCAASYYKTTSYSSHSTQHHHLPVPFCSPPRRPRLRLLVLSSSAASVSSRLVSRPLVSVPLQLVQVVSLSHPALS